MMKEFLQYQIVPFIIDDKQRGRYHYGITKWDENPSLLTEVAPMPNPALTVRWISAASPSTTAPSSPNKDQCHLSSGGTTI